jgi:uncharacterized protein with PIN domain
MLNKTSKLVLAFFITMMLATGLSFAQDHDSKDHKHSSDKDAMNTSTEMDSTKMDMSKDHMNMDHDKMMKHDSEGMTKDKSSIVREGVIDLKAIDENGDGKVYQDVMDWNVISDEPGECPQCGMKLKEVSLEKAKANLEKNGFKVK